MITNKVKVLGSGIYLPKHVVSFEEINNYLGTFPDADPKIEKWTHRIQPVMKEMLGIDQCYYAYDSKSKSFSDDNLSMSTKSACAALEDSNIEADEIDLIIYAGAYSYQIPPISTRIQENLGIDICSEIQIHSNCTGPYKALKVAHEFLKTGEYKKALVVSSNVASSCFIPEFYNQAKLEKEHIFLRWFLCDGAGALVLSSEESLSEGFFLDDTYIESAGNGKEAAMFNDYPYHWVNPLEEYEQAYHHIRQIYLNDMKDYVVGENDKTIFYNGLNRMLKDKNINPREISKFIVNMPSKFIREHIMNECVELGVDKDVFYSIVNEVGYSGPPAAIISTHRALKEESFKDGDLIMNFVMEVSKFMQAGFTLRYFEGTEKK